MEKNTNLSEISIDELPICYYDREYFTNANIHTIQDILNYMEDGSRLYFIKGVYPKMERDILLYLEEEYDIKYPYKNMDAEEYMRVYEPNVYDRWLEVQSEFKSAEPGIVHCYLKDIGLSQRVQNIYARNNMPRVGDILAYRYAGGDLIKGLRGSGESSVKELTDAFEKHDLNKSYEELSEPMKFYIDRRLRWVRLCKIGLDKKISSKLAQEGFRYIGQVYDYISKGNSLKELLADKDIISDYDSCELVERRVMDKLYKRGIPFVREVEYNDGTSDT